MSLAALPRAIAVMLLAIVACLVFGACQANASVPPRDDTPLDIFPAYPLALEDVVTVSNPEPRTYDCPIGTQPVTFDARRTASLPYAQSSTVTITTGPDFVDLHIGAGPNRFMELMFDAIIVRSRAADPTDTVPRADQAVPTLEGPIYLAVLDKRTMRLHHQDFAGPTGVIDQIVICANPNR